MSGAGSKADRKQEYFDRLKAYLDKYQKIVIVGADNVGSNQMQKIRQALRGKAEILMGKNVCSSSCTLPISLPYLSLSCLIHKYILLFIFLEHIRLGSNILQTMVRKVLREYVESNPKVEPLLGLVKNNVGFVFTNGDLADVEKALLQHRV